MRPWMIPWLFPAGIVSLLVLFAFTPRWVAGIAAIGLLVVGVPLVWQAYTRAHPGRELPSWLPGGRPPR